MMNLTKEYLMLSENTIAKIKELKERYPKKESALMPALMLAQKANKNYIDRALTAEVARVVGVPEAHAYGVLTYYTMYNTKEIGKYHLQVDTNIPATLMGANEIVDYLKEKLDIEVGETTEDKLFTLSCVEDLGSCGTCPVIQVNDKYYENMTKEKVDELIASLKENEYPENKPVFHCESKSGILLKNVGTANSRTIQAYKLNGGYKALEKARNMSDEAILKEVKDSMIRGRGGAGFPMGVKWSFVPKSSGRPGYVDNPGKPVYLVCNADEGEPGTFKDRQIMEHDPHLLIEGMAISAKALRSKKAFIYIRGEFDWIADILETAIKEAKDDGILEDLDIIVHRGGGAYVCGEETALIESLEGNRGTPRIKPPFPAVEGLYGCPTLVNNVETLSNVPFIITKGAAEYRKIGPTNNHGPKIYGISGNVNKPGVYEYPMGVQFMELLEAAGGCKGNLKAAIVGGLSTAIMTAEELKDLPMDYDSCIKKGTALGSGGIMVINDEQSIPELALRSIKFYAHESCGRCAPCRYGSDSIQVLLETLLAGEGSVEDIDTILHICKNVKGVTICPTGEAFSVPIAAMINKFRPEFEALCK